MIVRHICNRRAAINAALILRGVQIPGSVIFVCEGVDLPTIKLPDGNFSQARLAALALALPNSRKAVAFKSRQFKANCLALTTNCAPAP